MKRQAIRRYGGAKAVESKVVGGKQLAGGRSRCRESGVGGEDENGSRRAASNDVTGERLTSAADLSCRSCRPHARVLVRL